MSEEVSQGMLAAKLAEEDAQRKRLNDLAAEKVMGWTRIADVEGDMLRSPLYDIWEAHSLCDAWQPVKLSAMGSGAGTRPVRMRKRWSATATSDAPAATSLQRFLARSHQRCGLCCLCPPCFILSDLIFPRHG